MRPVTDGRLPCCRCCHPLRSWSAAPPEQLKAAAGCESHASQVTLFAKRTLSPSQMSGKMTCFLSHQAGNISLSLPARFALRYRYKVSISSLSTGRQNCVLVLSEWLTHSRCFIAFGIQSGTRSIMTLGSIISITYNHKCYAFP